jgi:tetratricopeptide (TPR) repeat protein
MLTPSVLGAAVAALEQVSEAAPGERGRRASTVALVLRTVQEVVDGTSRGSFLRRRAEVELDRLPKGRERALLRRLLSDVEEAGGQASEILVEFASGLEEARRLDEATAVLMMARALEPTRAEFALRSARVARLQGDREGALALYRVASELDGGSGSVARLSRIGEAVADGSEPALAAAIRWAIRSEDWEAAAVGLEERARLRRKGGNRAGAARDFVAAASRYPDAVDRARVAHQLADLFIAADDPEAAREALFFALTSGDRAQRDHARSRLHTVSRDLGDEVGMRRWRSFQRPVLVSLSSRVAVPAAASSAPMLTRWRQRVEAVYSRQPA